MERLEIKLTDFSKLEFRWVHAGLLSITRWVQGNEYSATPWVLSGCVVLGGTDLERLINWLQPATLPAEGMTICKR